MKREDADQLIRCVRECWWRLMLFIAIELLFIAIVLYGWPVGDWALGWAATGALGTVITGAAATYIGWQQKKWIQEKRDVEYYKIKNELKSVIGVFKFLFDMNLEINSKNKDCECTAFIKHYLPKKYEELKGIYDNRSSTLLGVDVIEDLSSLIVVSDFLRGDRRYADKSIQDLDAVFESSSLKEAWLCLDRLLKRLKR